MSYKLTDKQKTVIKNSITILYAENEQKNQHLLDYFDSKKIKHKSLKSLHIGDYTFMIEPLPDLGIYQLEKRFYGYKHYTIERKNSVEELSGNLGHKTERSNFDRELTRACLKKPKFMVVIEDENGYEKITSGKYNTNYDRMAYNTSLMGIYLKYNIPYIFISQKSIGTFIFYNFLNYIFWYLDDRIYKSNRF